LANILLQFLYDTRKCIEECYATENETTEQKATKTARLLVLCDNAKFASSLHFLVHQHVVFTDVKFETLSDEQLGALIKSKFRQVTGKMVDVITAVFKRKQSTVPAAESPQLNQDDIDLYASLPPSERPLSLRGPPSGNHFLA
jgi:hypothetical protein